MADIEHVARRVIVINHGSVIYDDAVASMRRTMLSTKLVEVSLEHPVPAIELEGVAVSEQTPSTLKLVVDYQTIAAGMLFTLVMGRLGGLVPALSAMRMEILDSLR